MVKNWSKESRDPLKKTMSEMEEVNEIVSKKMEQKLKDNNIEEIPGFFRFWEYPDRNKDNRCIQLDGDFSIKELKLIIETALEIKDG